MLPITHSSQRFHAIDQAVQKLPQVVTRIISEYDRSFDALELRKILKTMGKVDVSTPRVKFLSKSGVLNLVNNNGNQWPPFAAAARGVSRQPVADIIIELIDKFENCGLYGVQDSSTKKIVFTDDSEDQLVTQPHVPKRQYYYNLNDGPQQVLLEMIDGYKNHLVIKNGDMSHRTYCNMPHIFTRATFINIDFTGSTFIAQHLQNASFIDCNLTDVRFLRCFLQHATFSGSILKNTIFENFIDLSYAVFKDVVFDHTEFIETCLSWQTFSMSRYSYNSKCHGVVATDLLFLTKLRMHCSREPDESACIPCCGDLFFNANSSFHYTSPSKQFQKLISSCPIL